MARTIKGINKNATTNEEEGEEEQTEKNDFEDTISYAPSRPSKHF